MIRKIKAIIVAVIFFLIAIFFSSKVQSFILERVTKTLSITYAIRDNFLNAYNEHFNQKNEIIKLRKENLELQKYSILFELYKNEFNNLLNQEENKENQNDVKALKILSYVNIGDFNKFWIDFPDFKKDKIYGAICDNQSVGIIINNANQAMLVLQNDEKAMFSVFIGNEKIPGIANGDGQKVIIKYIPKWLNPQIGDEVYTSGLDNVFFEGLYVGEVVEVMDEDLYKSVKIKTNLKKQIPNYVYVSTN